MLTVKETTTDQSTKDQNSQDEAFNKTKSKIFESDVFKSLDLPSVEVQDEPAETVNEETSDVDEVTELTEDDTSEQEDEEVIPKSKVQKRFDELTAKIKQLESQIEERSRVSDTKDEITRKLENMSTEELKQARVQARLAQIEHKDDRDKVSQLLDLETKIEDAIHSAPQRFNSKQMAEFTRAVDRIAEQSITDGIDLSKDSARIREIATEIYQSTPEFQSSVHGQAKALNLAYKHFKEINNLTKGKSEVTRLKSQVNTFKKKTALDTKSNKGTMDNAALEEMRNKASRGSLSDKMTLIKNDPRFNVDAMIPDEYKQ